MITVSCLRCYPRYLKALTGLNIVQFEHLLAELAPAYQAAQHQKLEREDRRRSIGAGRPFALSLEDRFLMGLIFLHLQPSFQLLSHLFGMDRGNIHREINQRVLPVFATSGLGYLRPLLNQDRLKYTNSSQRLRGPLRSLQQLFERFPGLNEILGYEVMARNRNDASLPIPMTLSSVIAAYPDSATDLVFVSNSEDYTSQPLPLGLRADSSNESLSDSLARRKRRAKELEPVRRAA